jgi:acyl-CoA thioesterase-1
MLRAAGRICAIAAGVLAGEAMYAILWPAPEQEEFDATAVIGPEDGVPLTVLVLGDSSCTGPGLSHPDEIWIRQTAQDLAAIGFRVTVDSVAVGGATVADLLADQFNRIDLDRYDAVLVSIGGNDALKGVALKDFEAGLGRLVESLKHYSDLIVLSGVGDLGSIPRLLPPLRDILRARAKRFDAAHARVAEHHRVVKADQWATTPAIFADRAIFTPDLFHPGPVGHRAWADVATGALRPHLDAFRV